MDIQQLPLSIGQYIELINEQLKIYQAHIVGEITQVKVWTSGHVYFTLKDKEQGAVLDCVIWKGRYALYGIKLEVGMELIASGHANMYPPSGRISFIANTIELVGEGALKKNYDALKKKLTLEGVFDDAQKRSIPTFPRKIGIITSMQGAVIHDFINNLGRHGFQITCINSRVEGVEALDDLYQALTTLKRKNLDVIILMRGGGSIQSLAAFDAEILIREVASSITPIIAAIGHHEDVPLCALAADQTVSTPTAAANMLNTSWDMGVQLVLKDSQRIFYGYMQRINDIHQTITLQRAEILNAFYRIIDSFSRVASQVPSYLSQISLSLQIITKEFSDSAQKIWEQMEYSIVQKHTTIQNLGADKIVHPFKLSLQNVTEKIDTQNRLINLYDPLRQLSFGYSLVQRNSHNLVKSIKDVTIGEEITIITKDGTIDSVVHSIKEKKYDTKN